MKVAGFLGQGSPWTERDRQEIATVTYSALDVFANSRRSVEVALVIGFVRLTGISFLRGFHQYIAKPVAYFRFPAWDPHFEHGDGLLCPCLSVAARTVGRVY